ncbi:MAG: FG-GAP repeat protein [Alphaproteobacteria bacterium]|nr:FG-GAP repeat protein [Alphaproteobacteria bacterium]
MRRLPWALVLALAGCGDKDVEPTDDSAAVSDDLDGDGFSEPEDCDDGDAAIHPGAPDDTCDGVDDDCDGVVDQAAGVLWYRDDDGDGFGDPNATPETACDAPAGYVDNLSDCDDANGDVHPEAVEACDGVDNNCDGLIDEASSTVWYLDADDDGYGDPEETFEGCDAPNGYVADGGDCDDTQGAVNPGAAELCDGVDNDCDGLVDAGSVRCPESLADADARLLGSTSNSGAGRAVAFGDLDNDGLEEPLVGAYGGSSSSDGSQRGVVFGAPSGSTGDVHLASDAAVSAWWGDFSGDNAGSAVAALDFDGDGADDLLIGSYGYSNQNGRVHLILDENLAAEALGRASLEIRGDSAGDRAGSRVANAGDVDLDGYEDALLTAHEADGSRGNVLLVFGGTLTRSGITETMGSAIYANLLNATLFYGETQGDQIGVSLGSLDLGAGERHVVLGADGHNSGAGAVIIMETVGPGETWNSADHELLIRGRVSGAQLGTSLAVGDLDGDGQEDLVAGELYGVTGTSSTGAVYVLLNSALQTTRAYYAADEATVRVAGRASGDMMGHDVAILDDADGLGTPGLVVGAMRDSAEADDAGAVCLFLDPASLAGTLTCDDADAEFRGESRGDEAGGALAVGDADGDGVPDLLIGAQSMDGDATSSGGAYLLLGPP